MANEPPCMILDENYKDTGKRDYTRCNLLTCTSVCLKRPLIVRPCACTGEEEYICVRFPCWKPLFKIDPYSSKCHNLRGFECRGANASNCIARVNYLPCSTFTKKELDKMFQIQLAHAKLERDIEPEIIG
jgi:hypothetical protein